MEFGIISNALNTTVKCAVTCTNSVKMLNVRIHAIVILRVYNGLSLVFYFLQFHFCKHGFTKEMSSPSHPLYGS